MGGLDAAAAPGLFQEAVTAAFVAVAAVALATLLAAASMPRSGPPQAAHERPDSADDRA